MTAPADPMPGVFRLLDANLNRLSEGLRTAEDYARYVLDDAGRASEAKAIRHDAARWRGLLDAAAGRHAGAAEGRGIAFFRDAAGDVGREAKTPSERERATARDVAEAAVARSAQALRVIEEFSKLLSADVAREAEARRYAVYAWRW